MPIRAITFDFWNTLFVDANGEARQKIRIDALAEATGVPPDHAAEALRQVWSEFDRSHRHDHKTLRPEDAVRISTELLGVTVDERTAVHLAEVFATAILIHSPAVIDNALEAVVAASERIGNGRARIGLISDSGVSPGSSLRQLLDRHDFTQHFAAMAFSDEVGVAKPEFAMFERAASQLEVAPCEILHIGDTETTDVAGIKDAGGTGVLFCAVAGAPKDPSRADYVFRTWREFIDALPDMLD